MASAESSDDENISLACLRSIIEHDELKLAEDKHTDIINMLLEKENMERIIVAADGNCFFSSVGVILGKSSDQVRKEVCSFMSTHATVLSKYIDVTDLDTILSQLGESGTWKMECCDILPVVIANMYARPVRLFSSVVETGCILDFVPDSYSIDCDIRDIAIHMCLRAVLNHEHYDAAVPKEYTEDTFTSYSIETDSQVHEAVNSSNCTSSQRNAKVRARVTMQTMSDEDNDDDNDETFDPDVAPGEMYLTEIIKRRKACLNEQYPEHGIGTSAISPPLDRCDGPMASTSSQIYETDEPAHNPGDSTYDSCDLEESSTPAETPPTRKRKRNPASWKRAQRKHLRAEGKGYINASGKARASKEVQECNCMCKYKCNELFDYETRKNIFNKYYGLADYNRQHSFICRFVKSKDTLQGSKRKKCTLTYYLPKPQDEEIRVCKAFFLATYHISHKTVVFALKNSENGVFVGNDKRGRHIPHNKTNEALLEKVRIHINSYPVVESHYQRKSSKRKYLECGLSVPRMVEMFKVLHGDIISESRYRTVFSKEFNLGFHRPKKDECQTCAIHKQSEKEGTLTDEQNTEYAEHIERKNYARDRKDANKTLAQSDPSVYAATFDLQAVLSTPCGNVSQLYYRRKLSSYNLSIYDLAKRTGTCYLWSEVEGGRGSSEIGTCLLKHLSSLPETIKHVYLHSDSCFGQNRNKYIACALLHAVSQSSSIEDITLAYLETGHTQMECDSMHSAIEHAKSKTNIYAPCQWENVMILARRHNPYIIVSLTHKDFIDLKKLEEDLDINFQIDTSGNRIGWAKVRCIKVVKDEQNTVYMKDQHTADYRCFQNRRTGRRSKTSSTLNLVPLFTKPQPITEAKKKDLVALCKSNIIPSVFHTFYNDLPSLADRSIVQESDTD